MPLRSMAHGGQWRPGDAGTTGTEPGRLQRDLQCRPPTQTMTVEDVSGPSWRGAAAAARPLRPARSRRTWRRLGSVRVSSERTHEGQHPSPPSSPRKATRTCQTHAPDRRVPECRGSALTFRSAAVPDVCTATQWPTSAARRAAPLFSAWTQAVRICCHHGDTDCESQASSMATARKV